MCVFKIFKTQIALLTSLFLLSSCDFLSIGSETQEGVSSRTGTTNSKPGSIEDTDARTGICKGVKISALRKRNKKIAEQNGGALFYVKDFKEERIEIFYNKNTRLPDKFLLHLKACLTNARKILSPVPAGAYTIKYKIFNSSGQLEERSVPSSTERGGCLTWHEEYPLKSRI